MVNIKHATWPKFLVCDYKDIRGGGRETGYEIVCVQRSGIGPVERFPVDPAVKDGPLDLSYMPVRDRAAKRAAELAVEKGGTWDYSLGGGTVYV